MRKSKSFRLESLLEQRIKMGDYALVRFPSERKLAAAEGVTQMTARKAIIGLERRGLLERLPNGTVSPSSYSTGKGGVFALLAPAYPSSYIFLWQRILTHEAYSMGWRMKLLTDREFTDAAEKMFLMWGNPRCHLDIEDWAIAGTSKDRQRRG